MTSSRITQEPPLWERDDTRLFKLSDTFLGCLSLHTGVWVMAIFDLLFGGLMAASYFRAVEIPLVIAGCTRVLSGLWCIVALLTDIPIMMNLYLLMLLFNNCLVLSVCISFLILLTSDTMIVCRILPKPTRPGEPIPRCPLIYRQGFWEAILTTAEFLMYLYFSYVMICFLNRPRLPSRRRPFVPAQEEEATSEKAASDPLYTM